MELLPSEIFCMITNHLSTWDEYSLSMVSKRIRFLVMEDFCRPKNAAKIDIDYPKESLEIVQPDGNRTIFLNEIFFQPKPKYPKCRTPAELLYTTYPKKVPETERRVFFIVNHWRKLNGEYLEKLRIYSKQRIVPVLRVSLQNHEIPQSFLEWTGKIGKLEIRHSEETSTPLPNELLPMVSKVTSSLNIDYMLSLSQILHFSLSSITCTITSDEAPFFVKLFYTETFPECMQQWNFNYTGSLERLVKFMDQATRAQDIINWGDEPPSVVGVSFAESLAYSTVSPNWNFSMNWKKEEATLKFRRSRGGPPKWAVPEDLQIFHDIPL